MACGLAGWQLAESTRTVRVVWHGAGGAERGTNADGQPMIRECRRGIHVEEWSIAVVVTDRGAVLGSARVLVAREGVTIVIVCEVVTARSVQVGLNRKGDQRRRPTDAP